MVDENPTTDTPDDETLLPAEPPVRVPPIESRFLFVDVAALRAKQLRRGARPRLSGEPDAPNAPKKPERVAMEEVREGLVPYELPDPKAQTGGEEQ